MGFMGAAALRVRCANVRKLDNQVGTLLVIHVQLPWIKLQAAHSLIYFFYVSRGTQNGRGDYLLAAQSPARVTSNSLSLTYAQLA